MPSHPSDAGFAELQTNPLQQAQSAKNHRFPESSRLLPVTIVFVNL
jgi:hypothetical protein